LVLEAVISKVQALPILKSTCEMTEASLLEGYHQNLNTVQAFTETESLYFLGEQLGNC
jgi:hypothetical protein